VEFANEGIDTVQSTISHTLQANVENLILLDFAKSEKGLVDGELALVYGYPKANELDYIQGDAVPDFWGTCALTSIANLLTQANRPTTESDVINRAIAHGWVVSDPSLPAYERGGSNYMDQQALLDSYGIRNDLIAGYNEQGVANLIRSGRGVIIAVNAGKLWGEPGYVDGGGVNHAVTITGVVYSEVDGELLGFYIADSGRHKVSDMTRFVDIASFREAAQVPNAYAIFTKEALKLWDEEIDGTGNELDNVIVGNRADNTLMGLAGNDTLQGGEGEDTLIGGLGNDLYIVEDAGDVVIEQAGQGTDTVQSSISFALSANVENLTLTGSSAINATGNLLSNILTGNSGNNILVGGLGNDHLIGGGGNDTYVFGRNDGHDVITNGLASNTGPSGTLQLASDLAPESVWFKQSGQDLVIEVMGSDDDVTVAGWFANSSSALSQITTSNGWVIDGQVSQLVQAMASYSSAHAGFDTQTGGPQVPTDAALQAAIAGSWHQQAA
jgi:Ca2+-binding RTX toxin-like protein